MRDANDKMIRFSDQSGHWIYLRPSAVTCITIAGVPGHSVVHLHNKMVVIVVGESQEVAAGLGFSGEAL